nr:sugar ABC transporter permease [Cohnella sp. LGH]
MKSVTRIEAAVRRPSAPNGYKARIVLFLREIWAERMSYLFLAPFLLSFTLFIIVPVALAMLLSLTSFNGFEFPRFIGISNFIYMFTQDVVFMKYTIPNTLKFSIVVGPGGYILSFVFAWLIHQLPQSIRNYFSLAVYAPSIMATSVALTMVWTAAFSGDSVGYLNSILLSLGLIESPQLWLQDPKYLMTFMIIVTLWTNMGVGFLAMLGGLQTVNTELYEAGRIDGVKSKLQEVYYITIPSMKPQMLFSAVMAIVGAIKAGSISSGLSGMAITPQYAGHVINNHIYDYAFLRYEWGYASALSVVLLLMSYGIMRLSYKLFGTKEDE